MATITRAVLSEAVHREAGLPRREAAELVDAVIEAIAERPEAGETVKISGFGSFSLRDKAPRKGRNPRTGEAAAIAARRIVVFKPSLILKRRVGKGMAGAWKDHRGGGAVVGRRIARRRRRSSGKALPVREVQGGDGARFVNRACRQRRCRLRPRRG